uniref:Uncharacterized protein n=1 Tax=Chaetoceros debilis TaxID=122233 RepID=A0A7S3Q0T9_9STRA|mmetsp:Transcript_13755/g.20026  ORF Transcript_13755/g.20026 Transcript_13755/m.20026 type:complete len:725 (-) Transcript_13755:599-2773(-)
MSSPEEIWSMRCQRELLALTEEGEKKDIGILPPFIEVQDTSLDIAKGHCTVSFAVTVEGVECGDREKVTVSADKIDSQLGEKEEDTLEAVSSEEEKAKDEDQKEKLSDEDKKNENESDVATDSSEVAEVDTEAEAEQNEDEEKFKVRVVITMVASLTRRHASFNASRSYPFFKPSAFVSSGASHLPSSTNIKDGDEIQIDCDWTPSLHLNDAALNIALKVKESIKRGEPCLKVVRKERDESIMDEVAADFSAGATKVASFFSDLKTKASAVAEELDHAVGNNNANSEGNREKTSMKRPNFKPKRFRKKDQNTEDVETKVVTDENVAIGDEINLAMNPWNAAVGLYPCNAIRRPEFVVQSMSVVNLKSTKVAGAGLSGAGSMFRSFTKSAKSLVEESFLMLTDELILEIRCNKFSVANAIVSFAIPVSHLAKLKFRREESISLFFKQAPEDPIIYMCASSADAVKQIQSTLKRHGVKGKHTNATMVKAVQIAIQMIEDIKVMEVDLEESPSHEKVSVIMDLYRQAAEKFELAGDARHEEVMSHMRDFLAKPFVASILDGSFEVKQAASVNKSQDNEVEKETIVSEKIETGPVPVSVESGNKTALGPVPTKSISPEAPVGASKTEPISLAEVTEEAVVTDNLIAEDEGLQKAMQEAEDMIKDAHAGLEDLGLGDIEDDEDFAHDHDAFLISNIDSSKGGDVVTDTVSELEDMLKDADKELQELMGS